MSTSKTSAREALLAYARANGWTLDPTAQVTRGRYGNYHKAQDPHVFVRPAAHGGTWRIALDYNEASGYSYRTGNTLRGVSVAWVAPEGSEARGRNVGRLRTPTKYSGSEWLWETLSQAEVTGKHANLRQRAELLVANPDLAVWLAVEKQEKAKQRDREDTAARRAELEARRQPLPVTISDTAWAVLSTMLDTASRAVVKADGKTDLPAALDALKAAVAAVDAVVIKPEKLFDGYTAEEVLAWEAGEL